MPSDRELKTAALWLAGLATASAGGVILVLFSSSLRQDYGWTFGVILPLVLSVMGFAGALFLWRVQRRGS